MGRKRIQKLKAKEKEANRNKNDEIEPKNESMMKPKTKQIKKKGRKSNSYKLTMLSKETKREKNETKNTVKNYGKELIKFVHENRSMVEKIIVSFSQSVTF